MKTYRAFGLSIRSEIKLLSDETSDAPDLLVRRGVCPERLDKCTFENEWLCLNTSEAIVKFPDIGRFYAHDGNEIIADLIPDADEEVVRMVLLGTCMGAILQQRGIVPIHGSCVTKDDIAIVISGNSGAGKSTLAAELISRGWKLMSDDVTPIYEFDGVFYAQSTYPGQKLWQDTLDRSNSDNRIVGNIIREDDGREKFQLYSGEDFVYSRVPLKFGIVLASGSDKLYMNEITDFAKTHLLMTNLYRRFMVTDKSGQTEQLRVCLHLAEQIRLFTVIRPTDEVTEKEIAQWIIDRIGE